MKEARQFEAALLRGGPSGGASPDDRQDGQWPKQDSDPMQSPISCAGAHDAIVIPNQATAKFESGHQGPKQASTQSQRGRQLRRPRDLYQDRIFDCRPGPPRLTHSLTLLSMTSTSALAGMLQWLVGLGGKAIRQSGPFISARTAARH